MGVFRMSNNLAIKFPLCREQVNATTEEPFLGKTRVTTQLLTELIRRYVGAGRPLSIPECARRTGFSERAIETWVYGEAEPRSFGLKVLSDVLGEKFKRDLAREWLGLADPEHELRREIEALLSRRLSRAAA